MIKNRYVRQTAPKIGVTVFFLRCDLVWPRFYLSIWISHHCRQ
jgi:hypothetical protein